MASNGELRKFYTRPPTPSEPLVKVHQTCWKQEQSASFVKNRAHAGSAGGGGGSKLDTQLFLPAFPKGPLFSRGLAPPTHHKFLPWFYHDTVMGVSLVRYMTDVTCGLTVERPASSLVPMLILNYETTFTFSP